MNPPQVYPEGWYGEGGGRRVQDGEHIISLSSKRISVLLLVSWQHSKELHSPGFLADIY